MKINHTLEEYVMSQTVASRVSEINYHTLVSQRIVPVTIPPLKSDVNLETVNRIIVRISALDRLENLVHCRMLVLCRSSGMMYIRFFLGCRVRFIMCCTVLKKLMGVSVIRNLISTFNHCIENKRIIG